MDDKRFQGYANGCLDFHQKDKKKFSGFSYSPNVSCLAMINDVMMNNFVIIGITLKWNN